MVLHSCIYNFHTRLLLLFIALTFSIDPCVLLNISFPVLYPTHPNERALNALSMASVTEKAGPTAAPRLDGCINNNSRCDANLESGAQVTISTEALEHGSDPRLQRLEQLQKEYGVSTLESAQNHASHVQVVSRADNGIYRVPGMGPTIRMTLTTGLNGARSASVSYSLLASS